MTTSKENTRPNNSDLYSMIKEVDLTRSTWVIRVRVVGAYEVPSHSKGGARLKVVFHDAEVIQHSFMHFKLILKHLNSQKFNFITLIQVALQGDRIHAVIKRPFTHLYRTKLVENQCFRVKNFLVLDNYYNYKMRL
ncbi:unnamed protein product [Cuscuta europaea]|uniref:Replication protein A 70 kDa DNA-binding subunit B/D first OB fold domain-containing protein n=1 Tax=Cuscuta europaea TaxID=41803 RepID=A0A9P0ZM67_CUSEU|nr:unnamed protein product [Cuscuta europaea]